MGCDTTQMDTVASGSGADPRAGTAGNLNTYLTGALSPVTPLYTFGRSFGAEPRIPRERAVWDFWKEPRPACCRTHFAHQYHADMSKHTRGALAPNQPIDRSEPSARRSKSWRVCDCEMSEVVCTSGRVPALHRLCAATNCSNRLRSCK